MKGLILSWLGILVPQLQWYTIELVTKTFDSPEFVFTKLVFLQFPSIVVADDPPPPRIYFDLPRDYSWSIWVVNAQSDPSGRIWPRLPQSILHQKKIPYVIDVIPDYEDETGTTYVLMIYPETERVPPPSASSSRVSTWVKKIRRKPNASDKGEFIPPYEGPWYIRPLHPESHAIIPMTSAKQPPWFFREFGRRVRDFKVMNVGALYYLPQLKTGMDWVEHKLLDVPAPDSWLVANGKPYAIHAVFNPHEWTRQRSINVRIYAVDRDSVDGAHTREGPWRVRPASSTGYIELFVGHQQPTWIREINDPTAAAAHTLTEPLRDFLIADSERGKEIDPNLKLCSTPGNNGPNMIAVRSDLSKCMAFTLEDLIPKSAIWADAVPTKIKGEASTSRAGPSNSEIDLHGQNEAGLCEASSSVSVDSISLYADGIDRPIAQTVHTDHLDFHFQTTQARWNLLTMLYICVKWSSAGNELSDVNLNVKGFPDSPY